ncbi:MAG: hypothetical protein IPL61_34035 [Myxococcales bacterium]|nr:hypothetical protein [Myxococcales bacterium]
MPPPEPSDLLTAPTLARQQVSRHRTYLALEWPAVAAGTARAHRVALLGEVWDQPRALAVELTTPHALPHAELRAAHADVTDELASLVYALAVPDPWAAVLADPLPWLTLHAAIVWSPYDLSPEGQQRLRARITAHGRWMLGPR